MPASNKSTVNPSADAHREVIDLRVFKALEMRLEGCSYSQIAGALGVPANHVYNYVNRALAELAMDTAEKVEEIRQMELMRLDELLAAHWVNRAHPRHADIILKLQERRSKLVGLDVPQTDISDAATALRQFVTAARENVGMASGEQE